MASINDLAAAAIATSSGQQNAAGRGALIVLEGLDRSGKTTQVKLLEQRFVEAGKRSSKSINSLLASGTTVLCDRYYYSGVVYSAAKQNPALSLHWARGPEARERGGWGGEVYEKAEMQKRVRDLFWGLSLGTIGTPDGPGGTPQERSEPAGVAETRQFRQEEEDLVLVDASPSVEEVAEEIWKKVPRVDAVDRGEVGRTVRLVA
ncbi:unnamed protein product [Parascedosporium putredinis]|uniref:dTMP kinase n=1 Tax=Parascedosporium putredinis TaxID=1442378 RepID=A0A9P1M941_9PEZI|nr:unnamed protein product [Parascedosporium putredinis]CAI7994991.1 unnamed protein product [Parascedosporium putredinis]